MWPRIVNIGIGIWLMFAPWVIGHADPAAASDRTIGPLLAAFGAMAAWEVLRPLRWVSFALAVYLTVVPWVWGFPVTAALNDLFCGLLAAAMALIPGQRTLSMGGGWRALLRPGGTQAARKR